jgi:hypothetical protein
MRSGGVIAMTLHAVMPDSEATLVTFLNTHADLTPLHEWAATQVQATTPGIQVTSLGGTYAWPWEAVLEFQLSAWGGTKAQASQLARTAVAAVYELVGTAITGGRIVGVDVRLAPLWLPDETTGRPRYRADVALTTFPA